MLFPAFLWLALLVVFLAAEAATVSLVSLWFAAGALAALLAALAGASAAVQTVIFLAVSCVLLAALRPMVKKYIRPKITKTNVDALVGTEGIVTEAIDNLSAQGQVKLNGVSWTARSTSGQSIAMGATVRVDRIEGVKVFVTAVRVPTSL